VCVEDGGGAGVGLRETQHGEMTGVVVGVFGGGGGGGGGGAKSNEWDYARRRNQFRA